MLESLRKKCDSLLKRAKTNEDIDKYTIIKNMLSYDRCFFEMPIETAYSLLKDLNIDANKIPSIYMELIDKKEYDELY